MVASFEWHPLGPTKLALQLMVWFTLGHTDDARSSVAEDEETTVVEKDKREILEVSTELVYSVCLASPRS